MNWVVEVLLDGATYYAMLTPTAVPLLTAQLAEAEPVSEEEGDAWVEYLGKLGFQARKVEIDVESRR